MKKLLIILAIFTLGSIYSQEKLRLKGLTKKEIKALKRQQKEQDRITKYANMGLNQWGIDEKAQTWFLALKFHLPSSRQADGIPILRQDQSFTEESSLTQSLKLIGDDGICKPESNDG